jgi:hypothetical protein
MKRTGVKGALSRAGRTVLGIAAAILLVGCEGTATPTEVVSVEASISSQDAVTAVSSGGPGCIEGCVPGRAFITMDDAGVIHEFMPEPSSCTTRIVHERRTMTVELVLPAEVPRPSHNVRLDFESTGWRCPMPGPTWEEVCITDDWTFRVQPNGRLRGTCHIHDF